MDISVFFKPLDRDTFDIYVERKNVLGNVVQKFFVDDKFPELSDLQIAIFGVGEERGSVNNKGCGKAPDEIRKKLFELKTAKYNYKIADLGNLKLGQSLNDTYAAVAQIIMECLKEGVVPIILGGSHDLTFAQYVAYQKMEETVNIVSVDSMFDLGNTEEVLNSNTYLGNIILHEPNFLFNFSNIGYQTYFTGNDQIELMDKLFFDTYRLGQVRKDLEEVEPIVRNADILSFDISAIRQSDAPGNGNASPNGFYGEEACAITRYAGLSDKLTSIGFYEINPDYDVRNQTSHLTAQMIWYFIEGFYNRKKDLPVSVKAGFIKYNVSVSKSDHEIIFFKSSKSDRWWMEVPYPNSKVKYKKHHIVPCSYKDYEHALNDEMPERWWQAFQKLS